MSFTLMPPSSGIIWEHLPTPFCYRLQKHVITVCEVLVVVVVVVVITITRKEKGFSIVRTRRMVGSPLPPSGTFRMIINTTLTVHSFREAY